MDLLDKKLFAEKVRENLKVKNFLIKRYYKAEALRARDVIKEYEAYRETLKKYVADTPALSRRPYERRRTSCLKALREPTWTSITARIRMLRLQTPLQAMRHAVQACRRRPSITF